MDYFKGVQVEVICNGKSLKMYDDPDGPDDPELYKRQKYVEAITGDKFTVKVTLGHDFQFGSAEAARINFRFDQISHGWYKDILKSSWRSLRCESYELSSIASFCPVSATWKRKEFSFGGLIRTELPNVVPLPPDQIQALGQINISITRAVLVKLRKPIPSSKRPLNRIAEVSEKVLKGSAISNTVDLIGETLSQEPPSSTVEAKPIKGALGESLRFYVLYRSKDALQIIGCIPRTPSPELEPAALPSRSTRFDGQKTDEDSKFKDRDQELQELRARIALLEEGSPGVKPGPSSTMQRVKRERAESNRSQSSRKRSRTSALAETVDLTSD